jgi:DNA polymerase-2
VIYGDTDSVFVWLGDDLEEIQCREIGQQLAEKLNYWWRERLADKFKIESFLEIEFETHFLKFIMPTIRGSEKGSKKRYAGLIRKHDELSIVFKGLETVRTDWTRLARDFQQELYRRIFHDETYEQYIREVADDLMHGQFDEQLFYRKRIRRPLHEYQKNVPPHIQAARKLPRGKQKRSWIRYVITVNGPEPEGHVVSKLDYEHYLMKQLKPIADGILHFVGSSFDQVYQKQITMF